MNNTSQYSVTSISSLLESSVQRTTGTLRDWVIAFNSDAPRNLFSYRIFDFFSPFGIALEHDWALRDAFSQAKGQWQFMGRPLSTAPNTLEGPAYSQLKAVEALEAIDAFDTKALKSHQRRLWMSLSLFAVCLSVLIYLLPHMAANLLNSSFSYFSFLLCLSWGIGLTGLGYLCHRKTNFGRKAITPTPGIKELQLNALMLEDTKDWGPAVQSIFEKIKLAHGMPPKMTISAFIEASLKTISSLRNLDNQLQLANETNSNLNDLLTQADQSNNAMEQQIEDLKRQLLKLTADLTASQKDLSLSNAMVSALKLKVEELACSQKDLKKQLVAAQESNQKLQAGWAVSNGLLKHTRQDNHLLALRLDSSITQQATIQADLNRISAEAQQAILDATASDLRREEATVSMKSQEEKIADLEKKLSEAYKQIEELKNNPHDVKSPDGSISVSGDVLENLVLQNQAHGLTLSIGIPIAIMTWASFQDEAPEGGSRIGYTVCKRVEKYAEKVRIYASNLPQYRGAFNDNTVWEDYLNNIKEAVVRVMLPLNECGKISNPGASFSLYYPNVVRKNC